MDVPDLPTLVGLAPGAGVFALLVWLIVRIMAHGTLDRRDRREEIRDLRAAHAAEIAELAARHGTELAAARADAADLRAQLEAERRARWAAEDAAAAARRGDADADT